MDRLPLSDGECAAVLGMTREELLLARVPVARTLLERGAAYAAAKEEAERILDAARGPLMETAYVAYGLGMGYEQIAQCTGSERLTDEGRRVRTPPGKGVVTQVTISRWVQTVHETREQPIAS